MTKPTKGGVAAIPKKATSKKVSPKPTADGAIDTSTSKVKKLPTKKKSATRKIHPTDVLGTSIAIQNNVKLDKKIELVERISSKKKPRESGYVRVGTPSLAEFKTKINLALMAPFNPQVNHNQLASNIARYAGVAFVFVGGLFTLYNMNVFTKDMSHALTAQLAGTTTVCVPGTNCTSGGAGTPNIDTTPQVDIAVESSSNTLVSTVPITVTVAGATRVDIIVVNKRTNVPTTLGTTVRVSDTVWRSYWQTAALSDDEYRLKAVVTNQYGTYTKEGSTTYIVLNHPVTEPPISTNGSSSGTTTSPEATQPSNNGNVSTTTTTASSTLVQSPELTVSLSRSEPLSGTVRIKTTTTGATLVKHFIRMTGTADYTILGEAILDGEGVWRYDFDTKKVKNGEYDIRTQVVTTSGLAQAKTLSSLTVRNENIEPATTSPTTVLPPQEPTPVPTSTTTANITDLTPQVDLEVGVSGKLTRGVPLYVRASGVPFVEIYLMPERSLTPKFVGLASKVEEGVWKLLFDTTQVPNGTYTLYALAKNSYGEGTSKRIPVTIVNEAIPTVPPPEVATYIDAVKEVGKEVVAIETKGIPTTTKPVTVGITAYPPLPPIAPIVIKENTTLKEELGDTYDDALALLIDDFSTELTRIMRAYGKAKREGDLKKEQDLLKELEETRDGILEKVPEGEGRDVLLSKVKDHMNRVSQELRERTEKSETIIRERVGESTRKDTDNDGVTDYDEVNVYHTDPLLPDSDQDGFIDGAEILAGFDPRNAQSEANVVFESPKDIGVVRDDILTVDHITTVQDEEAQGEKPIAHIGGRALPNSFVTIYIFSTPIVVTVKTDAEGNWSYLFDKELDDGNHEVYVGMTDNTGRIIAKSTPLPFVKTAEAFTPVGASEGATLIQPEAPSLVSDSAFLTIGSIAIVAIGLVLILLGLHVRPRDETMPSPA